MLLTALFVLLADLFVLLAGLFMLLMGLFWVMSGTDLGRPVFFERILEGDRLWWQPFCGWISLKGGVGDHFF